MTDIMEYYFLVKGDYIQSGDEYLKAEPDFWEQLTPETIGFKYGYTSDGVELYTWPPVRRLVHKDFKNRNKQKLSVGYQEQWGEEFEL